MRKHFFNYLLAILCLLPNLISAQKIVAYYPYYNWGAAIPSIQYSKLTDVVYGFITPNSTGYLQTTEFRKGDWNSLRDNAMAAGCKAHISVGGHNLSTTLAAVAGNATYRATLVNEIKKFVEGTHTLNNKAIAGVDIDWEFPKTSWDIANHLQLIKDLRVALGSSYEISIAVGGSSKNMGGNYANYHDLYFDKAVFSEIDYLHCMNYDLFYFTEMGSHNSPVLAAQKIVEQYVTNFGLPASKFILGVPFYGIGGWADGNGAAFKSFANGAAYNDSDGNYAGHLYNSKPMLEDKANIVCTESLGGMLIWEITQDATYPYSLLDAMYNYMQTNCSSLSCDQPDLGDVQTICTDPITLNSQVSAGGGNSIKWYKNNTLINGETGTTLVVTSNGTYKVEVTNGSCVKNDEVEITQSGSLQASASEAVICATSDPKTSLITVTGGSGSYKLFENQTGGNALSTGANFTINASDITSGQSKTYYVEEASTGVTSYTTSPATIPSGKYHAWAGTEYTKRCGQMIVADMKLTIKSLTAIVSAKDGATFNVGVLNSVDLSPVTSVGPFTYTGDGTSETWSSTYFEFDANIQLDPGSYMIYLDPASGSETSYGVINGHTEEHAESGAFTLKGSTFQSGTDETGFNIADEGESWWSAYGPFLKWEIDAGASATCGRIGVSVQHQCSNGINNELENNLSLFPNPTSSNSFVKFNLDQSSNVSLKLVNVLGEVMYQNNFGSLGAGNQQLNIPTSNFESGAYLMQLTVNNKTINQTLTVLK